MQEILRSEVERVNRLGRESRPRAECRDEGALPAGTDCCAARLVPMSSAIASRLPVAFEGSPRHTDQRTREVIPSPVR